MLDSKYDARDGRKLGLSQVVTAVILLFSIGIAEAREAEARDFGVIGKTSDIHEKDAVEEIKEKLMLMEKTGQLTEHNEAMK